MATKLNNTLETLFVSASEYWNFYSPLNGERRPVELVVDKPTVNAFARMLVRSHEDPEYGERVNTERSAELDALSQMFERGLVRVGFEQENDALAWLFVNRRRLHLGTHEIGVLRNFSHFSLAGFRAQRLGMRWTAAPIWEAHGVLNGSFAYVAWPWQSGLKPQLVLV